MTYTRHNTSQELALMRPVRSHKWTAGWQLQSHWIAQASYLSYLVFWSSSLSSVTYKILSLRSCFPSIVCFGARYTGHAYYFNPDGCYHHTNVMHITSETKCNSSRSVHSAACSIKPYRVLCACACRTCQVIVTWAGGVCECEVTTACKWRLLKNCFAWSVRK